jgi:hypothetical protein
MSREEVSISRQAAPFARVRVEKGDAVLYDRIVMVGRFAPSPTGPLHLGSLVAAVGSWLFARREGGEWLVRMEDLETPRVVAGSADEILHVLERYGLTWDGEVVYQSQRRRCTTTRFVSCASAISCTPADVRVPICSGRRRLRSGASRCIRMWWRGYPKWK